MMENAETIRLDGRTISFVRMGRGSRKILFFHGFPGSSVQVEPLRAQLERFNLEAICLDRPGYNLTDPAVGPQFEQASSDAMNLLKSFGWTSCEVISVSGGTPFLFSFVQSFPQFVSRISVVCGLGPIATKDFRHVLTSKSRLGLKIFSHLPGVFFEKLIAKNSQAPSRGALGIVRSLLPASRADRKALADPKTQQVLGRALVEAFRQKGQGPKQDASAFLTSWSLNLGPYQGPLDIWHGDEDEVLPMSMAKQMAKSLPGSRLHLCPGEGHYSLAIGRIQDVLQSGLD